MDRIADGIYMLHTIDRESERRQKQSRLPEWTRLLTALVYLFVLMSFGKYDIAGPIGMLMFPLSLAILEEIPLGEGLRRFWPVFPLLLFVGIANPFFDRKILFSLGMLNVTGGMVSLLTLFMKGVLAVLSCYVLIMEIGIYGICRALTALKLPQVLVTVIMLTYRYIIVLLKELELMHHAYALRAPGQKGIHFKAWGSYLGTLLLRSIDRAQTVYGCMKMRGYDAGRLDAFSAGAPRKKDNGRGILYLVLWSIVFIVIRVAI